MALKLSTGTGKKLLDTGSFRSVFNLCKINIYSGAQASSPDAAATGTLLCTITVGGGGVGLTWEAAAVENTIEKESTETWSGTVLADGTAGWFRIYESGDAAPGSASTTVARVDGSIATSGADMNLGSLTLTTGATFTLTAGTMTIPLS